MTPGGFGEAGVLVIGPAPLRHCQTTSKPEIVYGQASAQSPSDKQQARWHVRCTFDDRRSGGNRLHVSDVP
jgi:hypothetical protein